MQIYLPLSSAIIDASSTTLVGGELIRCERSGDDRLLREGLGVVLIELGDSLLTLDLVSRYSEPEVGGGGGGGKHKAG